MDPHTSLLFEGCATALMTPFKDGKVDFPAFETILQLQIDADIDALVVTGTTGESSTLTDREKRDLYTTAVRAVRSSGKKIPVIAGTGSNNTARAVELSRMAEAVGCDGLLVVTPYYNKASQEGLVAHFSSIVNAVSIPAILYHVPSRTGCTLTVDTCKKLSAHPRIVGLKDATGQIGYSARIAAACGDSLPLYSGNDDMVTPILALGGHGVISVVSNLLPETMVRLCRAWREKDTQTAAALQSHILPLCDALFCEVNPIPVKCAMALKGLCQNELRLPLNTASTELESRLRLLLSTYGINAI
ncbi:MAG: 4-hydroxy-tetrahydrodipicolinate synthase [Clostridia bacterium]|nr:4-hydroxy-tetrahydrodipicolinate synthase [Clostridia bacterium]